MAKKAVPKTSLNGMKANKGTPSSRQPSERPASPSAESSSEGEVKYGGPVGLAAAIEARRRERLELPTSAVHRTIRWIGKQKFRYDILTGHSFFAAWERAGVYMVTQSIIGLLIYGTIRQLSVLLW